MNDFVANEWRRAQRSLRSAELLLSSDPESSVSRAYYAAFHALTALFALQDQTFTKHSALRAALHRDLIHSNQWPVERGKDYDQLLDLRETGDYSGLKLITHDDASRALEAARRILTACQTTQPDLADTQ